MKCWDVRILAPVKCNPKGVDMNHAVSPASLFLNVAQVAERYDVSTDTIWRWAREGDMPRPVKVGPNVTRWRLSGLIEHEGSFQIGLMLCLDLAA